ncbi:BTAD domain-containing putative transcriptional regulator [Nonomuraea sp. 10N515B]|uniref:BTAD domain-containing putative transcriptional regulator n=1 Tax=Nonomuraea sp. 10N515B TaxID=3457422 RepID=UPI003FCC7440
MSLRFGILGPPVIWQHDQEIRLTTRRSRAVLAHLILSPSFSASVDRLIDVIYGDAPGKSARNQVHRGVGELRRHGVTIEVHDNVYTLDADEEAIDAFVFTRLCDRGRAAARAGDHAEGARTLRAALALWRAPALAGLDSTASLTAASAWNERRLSAMEERIDADLALGRHRELIAELRDLTDAHPMRERFYAQLMLALYRAQRGSEALAVFAGLERLLRDELGTDPDPELRKLQLRVLRQDPGLGRQRLSGVNGPRHDEPAARPPTVPRQLPPRPGALVGRDGELAEAVSALRGGVGLLVMAGPGGIGKTALALEAAHRVAGDFPDGQLYADGSGDPGETLKGFLSALGVREIPDGVTARSVALRSALAVRRVLIVLDGAADPGMVLPFRPGSAGSAVVVTSRSALALLRDAHRVTVPALTGADARRLLAATVGEERLAAEREAADRIVELCAGLPVALTIAAAKLAARPHWPLKHLADRLADPSAILDTLRHDGQSVRPTLRHGYAALSPRLRALARAIGCYGVPEISSSVAAALAGLPVDTAENLLAELAEAHFLVPEGPAEGGGFRYRCPELLLAFTAERAAAEDAEPVRRAAVERALGTWLTLADAAHARLRGRDHAIPRGTAPRHPAGGAEPGPTWLADHLDELMTGVRRAAATGLAETCWELAIAPLALLETGPHFARWLESHQLALDCVRQAGNIRGEGALLYSLGQRALLVGDYVSAGDHADRALELFGKLDDRHGKGLALRLRGDLHQLHEDLAMARDAYEEAASLLRESGDPVAEADALGGLAMVFHRTGEQEEAQVCLGRALELCSEGGSLRSEAQIRRGLAKHAVRTGTLEKANLEFEHALDIARHLDDRVMQSQILLDLGTTRILLGDPEAAQQTLACAEEMALSSGLGRVVARTRTARAFLAATPASPPPSS